MVALLIGTILMGAAISIFIGNKSTNSMVTELSRMQEAGRFAIDYMSEEIRLAGYYGCTSRFEKIDPGTVKLNVKTLTQTPFPFTEQDTVAGVHGFNGEDKGKFKPTMVAHNLMRALYEIDGDISKKVVSETDVINIQRSNICQAPLTKTAITKNGVFELYAQSGCGFKQYDTVMIADCETADAFTIQNNPVNKNGNQTIQHSVQLNNSDDFTVEEYGIDAYASKLRSNTFFVGTTDRFDKDENRNDIRKSALYVASWAPADNNTNLDATDYIVEELVEGVEDMQIQYGVDTSGDEYVDSYDRADQITDWSTVRNVRIHILMRSKDLITTEAHDFEFLDKPNVNTRGDRRLRMVFSTTIALRNRLQ
jgi:type IV pilus assembly protein PilW